MRVFEIVPTVDYFAGVALVAADNTNVAISLWKECDEWNDNLWVNGKCNCFENKDIIAITDTPKVLIDTICDTSRWSVN